MTRDIARARLKQIACEYGGYKSRIDRCSELIDELDMGRDEGGELSQHVQEYESNQLSLFHEIDEIVDGLTEEVSCDK